MNMETYNPNACPKCGSDTFDIVDRDVTGYTYQADSSHIWQYLACDKCDESWTEEYTLTGVWTGQEENCYE